jgi:hypothetical protein
VSSTSIITIRVAREIKEKLEKYNVNISETLRKLLTKYLIELEMKNLAERLELLKKTPEQQNRSKTRSQACPRRQGKKLK